jgi:Rrf2 family transcriptional regulator, cysteine metabolism repressor
MNLSPAAELAMRGMLILTEHHGQGPTRLADICAERDLGREYLSKVLGMLARADLVQPIRGKNGGYKLARDPSQITLLEVIEAVEGEQALNLCQHDPPKCEYASQCKVQEVWAGLQKIYIETLGSKTLADMTAEDDPQSN